MEILRLTPFTAGTMADKLSQERRSWNMARIRSFDTVPELAVKVICTA